MKTLYRGRRKEMGKSLKSLIIFFVGAVFVLGLTIGANVKQDDICRISFQIRPRCNLTGGAL